ncbi:MIOREX complex component 7 [[Candida] anglica]
MDSPAFNNWVKRVHARINGLPPPHLQQEHQNLKVENLNDFHPTRYQKFNAFRIIWADEFKRSFGFGRRN